MSITLRNRTHRTIQTLKRDTIYIDRWEQSSFPTWYICRSASSFHFVFAVLEWLTEAHSSSRCSKKTAELQALGGISASPALLLELSSHRVRECWKSRHSRDAAHTNSRSCVHTHQQVQRKLPTLARRTRPREPTTCLSLHPSPNVLVCAL